MLNHELHTHATKLLIEGIVLGFQPKFTDQMSQACYWLYAANWYILCKPTLDSLDKKSGIGIIGLLDSGIMIVGKHMFRNELVVAVFICTHLPVGPALLDSILYGIEK